jgi:hypothetical protein
MEVIRSYDFEGRMESGVCDYPFSLMEGVVGDIHAMIDTLCPSRSVCPGLEIWISIIYCESVVMVVMVIILIVALVGVSVRFLLLLAPIWAAHFDLQHRVAHVLNILIVLLSILTIPTSTLCLCNAHPSKQKHSTLCSQMTVRNTNCPNYHFSNSSSFSIITTLILNYPFVI